MVEQQAKSAEESKAERLKRQQARFRDRGGAFVPSNSNPLVDILLARTVSGESPSKRLSLSKTRQPSVATVSEESQAVAGSSKPTARKGKAKVVKPQASPSTKPPPKRRGPAKGKKKAPDSEAEQSLPANTKSKSTSKGKGKQRAAPSTKEGNPKTKPKPKAKARPKELVEVLVSDDDTLVEVPCKAKSNPKRNVRHEDDGDTDDDAPLVRKQVKPRVDASGSKTATRVKAAGAGTLGKKTLGDDEERTQDVKPPKAKVKKRPVSPDDDDDDIIGPPAKKGKAANPTSAKPKTVIEPEPAPRPVKDVKKGENLEATGKRKGKVRAGPVQEIVEPVEEDDVDRPLERVPKPKKRKKEDNYDDRPRKVVKFSDTGPPPHSSSEKLKENRPDKKRDHPAKSSANREPDAPRPKLATKPPAPTRAKTIKGPPREVLERIKASAVRHLRCVDTEPDELDFLS